MPDGDILEVELPIQEKGEKRWLWIYPTMLPITC